MQKSSASPDKTVSPPRHHPIDDWSPVLLGQHTIMVLLFIFGTLLCIGSPFVLGGKDRPPDEKLALLVVMPGMIGGLIVIALACLIGALHKIHEAIVRKEKDEK